MLQQLEQVGMTYWTRPRFWWGAAFYIGFLSFAILLTLNIGRNVESESPLYELLFICFYGSFLPLLFLREHTSWHFNHSRARLVPDFNRSHLAFTAFFLFLLLVAAPLLFSLSTGGAVLTLMAISALAVSACGMQSWGFVILVVLLVISPENSWIVWLLRTPDASNQPVLFFLLFASWAIIGRWLYRLGNRHEEQTGYGLHAYADKDSGESRIFRLATNRKQSEEDTGGRFKGWQLDRSIESVLARADNLSKWCLLRLGNRTHQTAAFRVVSAYAMVLGLQVLFEYRDTGTVNGIRVAEFLHSSAYLLWLLTFIGAAYFGMQLSARAPFMTSESLLPLSKGKYLSDLLRGLAVEGVKQWIIFHVVILGILNLPLSAMNPPPTIATLLAYSLISLACFAFTFSSVTLLSCTLRGLGGAIVAVLVCATTTGLLYGAWLETREAAGDILFVVLAIGLMGVAWYFIQCTRRVWADIEMGDTSRE